MRCKDLLGAGLLAVALTLLAAPAARAQVVGLYYQEVAKADENRIYVFNTPERFHSWEASGDMGTAVTVLGAGPNGETVVAENETAMDLFNLKHDLPAYERPTPKPATPPPFPASKFGIRVFADVSSKSNEDLATGTKSNDSGVGFDVKRTYFTFTHQFDAVWSAQFQSDIGDQGARRYDVFVKKAFIEGKFHPMATFRLGSADTPWIPYVESIYGLRYLETTITDHDNFGTSAEWGLHVLGNNQLMGYQFTIGNGKGYSNPSRSDTVDLEGRVNFTPIKGLHLAVGGYTGKRGLQTDTTPARHTAKRLDALVAYNTDRFKVGAEYFQARNWNNVTTVAEDEAEGYSTWAQYNINSTWAAFARYDFGETSQKINPRLEYTYMNAGVQWTLNKAFAASLVYKAADVDNGVVNTSNGSIGSTRPGGDGEYREIGVFTIYNF